MADRQWIKHKRKGKRHTDSQEETEEKTYSALEVAQLISQVVGIPLREAQAKVSTESSFSPNNVVELISVLTALKPPSAQTLPESSSTQPSITHSATLLTENPEEQNTWTSLFKASSTEEKICENKAIVTATATSIEVRTPLKREIVHYVSLFAEKLFDRSKIQIKGEDMVVHSSIRQEFYQYLHGIQRFEFTLDRSWTTRHTRALLHPCDNSPASKPLYDFGQDMRVAVDFPTANRCVIVFDVGFKTQVEIENEFKQRFEPLPQSIPISKGIASLLSSKREWERGGLLGTCTLRNFLCWKYAVFFEEESKRESRELRIGGFCELANHAHKKIIQTSPHASIMMKWAVSGSIQRASQQHLVKVYDYIESCCIRDHLQYKHRLSHTKFKCGSTLHNTCIELGGESNRVMMAYNWLESLLTEEGLIVAEDEYSIEMYPSQVRKEVLKNWLHILDSLSESIDKRYDPEPLHDFSDLEFVPEPNELMFSAPVCCSHNHNMKRHSVTFTLMASRQDHLAVSTVMQELEDLKRQNSCESYELNEDLCCAVQELIQDKNKLRQFIKDYEVRPVYQGRLWLIGPQRARTSALEFLQSLYCKTSLDVSFPSSCSYLKVGCCQSDNMLLTLQNHITRALDANVPSNLRDNVTFTMVSDNERTSSTPMCTIIASEPESCEWVVAYGQTILERVAQILNTELTEAVLPCDLSRSQIDQLTSSNFKQKCAGNGVVYFPVMIPADDNPVYRIVLWKLLGNEHEMTVALRALLK